MNLYWVYALPNWLFGGLTIAVTVAIGVGGLCVTRKWVRRIHGDEHSHNEVVGLYLGAVCLFYGITLALLAVGTWQTYTDVETRVGEEAATVGALYRDVSSLSDPNRTGLPAWLWTIVLAGAFLNIAISWFFDLKSWSMHVWLTVMFCALLALLIFLLGALDNPFRGEVSVSPQPFELVYQRRMQAEK